MDALKVYWGYDFGWEVVPEAMVCFDFGAIRAEDSGRSNAEESR